MKKTVLLTGATGFVGKNLMPALDAAGYHVRCASRDPQRARVRAPEQNWVHCDVADSDSVRRAMEACDAAFYLVHSVAASGDYPAREAGAAMTFRVAAEAAGLDRIVYLGGVAPRGRPSRHLESRLRCGEILRGGNVSAVELRAAMIIGHGGASWEMVQDLARRLPAMVLPRWLSNHSWPVAIEDVVYALMAALELPDSEAGWYDVPGPERITHRELLARVATALGHHPLMVGVPFVTPKLSSYWIALVTRAKLALSRELVEGLRTDLDPCGRSIWDAVDPHHRVGLDESIAHALTDEASVDVPSPLMRERLQHLGAMAPRST